MAAVKIFFAEYRVRAYRDVSSFRPKKAQEPIALFADPAHPLLASGRVLARDQSQVACNLAPREAANISDG